MDKKENKILVKLGEKVYTFSSLKRDQPGRNQAVSSMVISRYPLARFVKELCHVKKMCDLWKRSEHR
jgi:hypothetical protein